MERTKHCPCCAKQILEAAIKCRHCGSDLAPGSPPSAETLPQGQLIKWPYKILIVLVSTGAILVYSARGNVPARPGPVTSAPPMSGSARLAGNAAVRPIDAQQSIGQQLAPPQPRPTTIAAAVTPKALAPSPLQASAAGDDTASLQAISPGAALNIRSYCTKATAGSGSNYESLKTCEHREIAAWLRVFVNREFAEHDPSIDRRCREVPFPGDSFVAYETCLQNELNRR
jgi:hypothetical protein